MIPSKQYRFLARWYTWAVARVARNTHSPAFSGRSSLPVLPTSRFRWSYACGTRGRRRRWFAPSPKLPNHRPSWPHSWLYSITLSAWHGHAWAPRFLIRKRSLRICGTRGSASVQAVSCVGGVHWLRKRGRDKSWLCLWHLELLPRYCHGCMRRRYVRALHCSRCGGLHAHASIPTLGVASVTNLKVVTRC